MSAAHASSYVLVHGIEIMYSEYNYTRYIIRCNSLSKNMADIDEFGGLTGYSLVFVYTVCNWEIVVDKKVCNWQINKNSLYYSCRCLCRFPTFRLVQTTNDLNFLFTIFHTSTINKKIIKMIT